MTLDALVLAFADDGGETVRLLREVGGHFIVTGATNPEDAATTVASAIRTASTGAPVGSEERLRGLMIGPHLEQAAELIDRLWHSQSRVNF